MHFPVEEISFRTAENSFPLREHATPRGGNRFSHSVK
jgi:hypothetical protein